MQIFRFSIFWYHSSHFCGFASRFHGNYVFVDHVITYFNAFSKRYIWNVSRRMDHFCDSVCKVNDIYIIREVRALHLSGIITDADICDTIYQQVVETEKTWNESQSLIPKDWNIPNIPLLFYVLNELLHVHETQILKLVVVNLYSYQYNDSYDKTGVTVIHTFSSITWWKLAPAFSIDVSCTQ